METNKMIVLSFLFLPIAILFMVGLYYVCITGILRILAKVQMEFYNYIKERRRIAGEIKNIQKLNMGDQKKDENENKRRIKQRKAKDNYVLNALLTAIAAAALFIAASIILSKCYGLYISYDNIVLTFVGILATFIVVTNYAQVMEIKKDLHNRIDAINMKNKRLGNRITHPEKFDRSQACTPDDIQKLPKKNIKSSKTKE